MNIPRVKTINLLSIFLLIAFVVGCATTSGLANKSLLDFLEDGKTTKETVILKLGQPSGTFEKESIITYLVGEEDNMGFFVVARTVMWQGSKYSLVLVFDDNKVLQKHSLVQVR